MTTDGLDKKRREIRGNREREIRRKGKSDESMEGIKTRIEPGGGGDKREQGIGQVTRSSDANGISER